MKKDTNTPLLKALDNYVSKERTIMHMPGHKQGKGFDANFKNNILKYDLTELSGLDNFHKPEGAILKSMEACAKAFGAKKSFFLVNGSTSGIHASFLSCFKKGDKILINRNCHISVIHALILFGIKPVFVMPDYMEEYGLPLPPSFHSWEKALNENPDAKGVLVTTPDYYGICQPLTELSALLHESGKLLLVDEAHGAHFAFSNRLPKTALEQGADLCIQSFHKTLPALTQSAVLHIGSSRINAVKVERAISMITTTSPSYIVMASMDYARCFADLHGGKKYDELINMLNGMKCELAAMKNLRVIPDSITNIIRDPTRIVIDTALTNITGYELYDLLYNEYGIAAEMCDTSHVVFILTMSDKIADIERITKALIKIDSEINRADELFSLNLPFSVGECSIPDIYDFLDSSLKIPLKNAEGCICADVVTPYPPGIPMLCPGEVITSEHIKYLTNVIRAGAQVHGLGIDQNGDEMVRVIERQ